MDVGNAITAGAAATFAGREFVVQLWGDAARPAVQQVGKALAEVVELSMFWAHERLEKRRAILAANLELYRRRMENVPLDQIVEVAPEIGVPLIDKLSHVRDGELADLYTALLASASTAEEVAIAHPSFVNVINNISPDEARLMKHVAAVGGDFPMFSVFVNRGGPRGELLDSSYSFVRLEAGIAFQPNFDAYLSNLEGLGVLESINAVKDETLQSRLASAARDAYGHAGGTIALIANPYGLSPFGAMFLRACHITAP